MTNEKNVNELIRELKQIAKDSGLVAIDVEAYVDKALEQLGVDRYVFEEVKA